MRSPAARVVRSISVFLLGAAVALATVAAWSQRERSQSAETVTVPMATGDSPDSAMAHAPVLLAVALRDGMYLVGVDLEPGTYVTRSVLPACYFAVTTALDGSLGSVVTTYFGDSFGRRVELKEEQYFETDECGVWTQEGAPTGAVP